MSNERFFEVKIRKSRPTYMNKMFFDRQANEIVYVDFYEI